MDWKQTLSTLKPFSMFIAHYKLKKKATCSKTSTTKLEQICKPQQRPDLWSEIWSVSQQGPVMKCPELISGV